MTEYDPGTIRDYADQLYLHANWIIGEYVMGGLLLGLSGGGAWAYFIATGPDRLTKAALVAALGGALCGYGLYLVGKQKALHMKAQAQQMLCWLTIEKNTRPGAAQESGERPPFSDRGAF